MCTGALQLFTSDDEHLPWRHIADPLEADRAEGAVLRRHAVLRLPVSLPAAQHQWPEERTSPLSHTYSKPRFRMPLVELYLISQSGLSFHSAAGYPGPPAVLSITIPYLA